MKATPAGIALALLTAAVGSLGAQTACFAGHLKPDLGFDALVCVGCLSSFDNEGTRLPRFTGLPAVRGIRPITSASSSTDLFREGDTLLAMNGRPIVSYGAARLLAWWQPGEMAVRLRRAGAPITVTITPTPVCVTSSRVLSDEEANRRAIKYAWMTSAGVRVGAGLGTHVKKSTSTKPDTVSRAKRPLSETPMVASTASTDELRLPRAKVPCAVTCIWDRVGLGAMLSCTRCLSRSDSSGIQYWFRDFPVIVEVTPSGFAERVGLRPLDSLVAIDGVSVLAAGGALRFRAPPNGARVTVEWSREGRRMTGTTPSGTPDRMKTMRKN